MRNIIDGWVPVPRELLRPPVCLTNVGLYATLASWANLYPTEVMWEKERIVLEPGHLVTSFRELAKQVKSHRLTIKKSLDELHHQYGLIEVAESKKGLKIHVKKFMHLAHYDSRSESILTRPEESGASVLTHECVSSDSQVSQSGLHSNTKYNNTKYTCSATALEALYKTYPKRPPKKNMGKASGMEVFTKKIKSDAELADLKRAVEHFASTDPDPEYVPMWSSFATKWRDYLPENTAEEEATSFYEKW